MKLETDDYLEYLFAHRDYCESKGYKESAKNWDDIIIKLKIPTR